MQLVITLFPYITWMLTAVCWWRIFVRANTPGWKALIPFYCDYTRFKIAGQKSWYGAYLLLTISKHLFSLATIFILIENIIVFLVDGTFNASGIEMKANGWGVAIILVVFDMFIGRCLAKKFGKPDAFGIGLGLIPIIFAPILAFGNAQWQEKEYI